MRKVFLLISLLVSLSVSAQESYYPGELIVMLQHRADANALLERINAQHPELRLSNKQVLSDEINIHLLHFDPSSHSATEAMNIVMKDPAIALIQFNHNNISSRDTCPGDPNFTNQWAFFNNGTNGGTGTSDIDACAAWDIATGGYTTQNDRIVVAVVDGGFDLLHQDLNFFTNTNEIAGNGIDDDNNGYIDDVQGWNFINNNNNVQAATWDQHATHVSGTVGAIGNNSTGVTGVNWDLSILPVEGSSNNESVVVAAYSYVLKMRRMYNSSNGTQGAFVVCTNSSFGIDLAFPNSYPIWCAMYDSLGTAGVLSAAATANANYNVDNQGDIPTSCPSNYLITVTNTKSNDTKNNAGYGQTTIDIGAPGTNIYSTLPNNLYGNLTGTSMATPHIAGTIALMWSAACDDMITEYKNDPANLALTMRSILLNSGFDVVPALQGITVTEGRLNLFKALDAIQYYSACSNSIEETSIDQIQFFPNPTEGIFQLQTENGFSSGMLELFDLNGKLVYSQRINGAGQHEIDIRQLPSSIYSLRLRTSENKFMFAKVIRY